MLPPLAVTGAGAVTAAGRGLDPLWRALLEGKAFPALDADPQLAGFAPIATARGPRLDPAALGADPRAARLMGRHTHMLLACVADALAEAGRDGRELRGEETGFFTGMDSVDPAEGDLEGAALASVEGGGWSPARFLAEGYRAIYPLWPLAMLNNIAHCQVAIQFGLRGENATFSPGPEAGVQAVAEAAGAVHEGRARAALAAGVGAVASARAVARYRERGLLLPGAGLGAGRPFAGGPGAILGEGAAALVLEAADRAGGRPALGRLAGWGAARAIEGRVSLSAAFRAAAEGALRSGGCGPEEVGLVLPHGGCQERMEAAEIEALAGLFGPRRPLALATKGALGHLLGGAPVTDLWLALRCLRERAVPPSPRRGEGAEEVLRFPDQTERAGGLRCALVLSCGLDGVCGALLAAAA
ncbi:MAG: beta-ketoacyl synthase N-terminal-like domain-containing protein [Nitrospinota bacterium]